MPDVRKSAGYATALAAMLVIATPFVGGWEGESLTPYRDVVGVLTVCNGKTRAIDPNKTYTHDECAQHLRTDLAVYGGEVAARNPPITASRFEWAAHTSFAYNIGSAGYGRSSVAALFAAGDRVEACRAMQKYKYAGGRVILGLVYRRNGHDERIGEYELCLAGAVPFQLTGKNV